ncbi:MAG TPA: GntR family transcriptional regulator, partial [Thermomicrobiales bacterium]|nr:GntR family transcriptional regulator [Thermomicrobiales bacterium]
EVTDRLRALILNNDLPPGTHLVEASLGKLLGVSRGPIREALRALDREGLVIIAPHKGAVVVEWSLQDMLDAYDVRALLEIRAMELAAERSGASCAEELTSLLTPWEEASQAGDREKCADLDLEFHRVIWRHSNNRSLVATLEQTIHPLQTVFYLNSTRYDDLVDVVALHRRVRDAVATEEVPVARAAMEAHMKNSLEKARRHPERFGG